MKKERNKKNNEKGMKEREINEKGLLPFDVIVRAKNCEYDALMEFIKHYESYIDMNAKRWFKESDGSSRYGYDPHMADELKVKLIKAFLFDFDIRRVF